MGVAEAIAIVGMAGRFPAANDISDFIENIFSGRECLTQLSDDTLATAEWFRDPHASDYVRRRPLLEDADGFDAGLFSMTRREAELRDPQYRLMLETCHAALEHAGYDPFDYGGSVGVFAGANINRYRYDHIESRPDIFRATGFLAVDTSNNPDYMSTFVSYKLGLRGPSLGILTACSTSLVAVHTACVAIRAGDCDMALAGGVDIEFPYNAGYQHLPGGIASHDGVCRPFDAGATGTNFGNGVGAVLLKPLSAALAEGDAVYSVILGSAVNNDGDRKVGYVAPSVAGQSECVQLALRAADVDPRTITYVEAHGTGTAVGDPIEVAGLTEAYRAVGGPDLPNSYCTLGSVKANVGHLGQAAGVAGLIKTVLALHHKRIPPSINITEPSPAIGWEDSPFRLSTVTQPWPAPESGLRRAGVSAFGVGGTNAHVVLEEAPAPPASTSPRLTQAVLWSAVDPAAFEQLRERLATRLETSGDDFPHVAHTLRVGRTPRRIRGAVLAADGEQAVAALRDLDSMIVADDVTRTVTFAFPGQGAQRPGMLRDLYDSEPFFRTGCDAAFDVLTPLLGRDLRSTWVNGSRDELAETSIAQPLLYVMEYTLAHSLMRWGVQPVALIGHSLGELAAAAVAGVFDFESGLRAVAARARLMQDMPRGRMLAVAASAEEVADLITGEVSLAAVNAPGQIVLAGPAEALDAVAADLATRGVPTGHLATSHAFHSPAMAEAAAGFAGVLAGLPLREPELTVVSAATGEFLTAEQACSPAFWADQLIRPVNFDRAAETLLARGSTTVLELGPERTLGAMLRGRPDARTSRSRVVTVPGRLQETLARLWVDGEPVTYWRQLADRGYRRVAVPGYPYQRSRHWIDRTIDGADTPATGPATAVADGSPVSASQARTAVETGAAPVEPGWSLSRVEWVAAGQGRPAGIQVRPAQLTAAVWQPATADVRSALGRAGYRAVCADLSDFEPTSEASWQRLIERANAPALLVHAGLLALPPEVTGEDLDAQFDLGVHSLFAAIRAIGRHRRPVTLVVLGRNQVDLTGGEPINPVAAGANALLRSAEREISELRVVCVDVGDRVADDVLARELSTLEAPLVALRGTSRWLPVLRPMPRPSGPPELRYQGTYVITGGVGGLGLTVARALARTGLRPRLALLGRSARALNAELRASDAEVEVFPADVNDPVSLTAAIDEVQRRFGPVHGVVHAAGVAGGGLAQRRETEEIRRVLAPKTRGLLNLEAVFAGRAELDFLILFSSQAGLAGLYGSADYAAANAFMDAHSVAVAGRQRRTLSVQWPGWADVGMAARSPVALQALTGSGSDEGQAALVRTYTPGDAWEFDEHVFGGRPVLPGTAMLELAVMAARATAVPDGPVELRDVVFLAPIAGDGPVDIRVLVTAVAGVHRFRLQARPEDRSRGWTDHANGVVAAGAEAPRTDLDALRERITATNGSGLADWIEFGRRWDTVVEALGDDHEKLARLILAEEFHGDFDDHPLHPALVDVASGVLTDLEPGRAYSPFLYRRATVYHPLTADLTVHIRLGATSGRKPRPVDFDLYDTANGALLARFEGFVMREVRAESFADGRVPDTGPGKTGVGMLSPDEGAGAFLSLLTGDLPPVVNVDAAGTRLEVPAVPWADSPGTPATPATVDRPASSAPAPAVAAVGAPGPAAPAPVSPPPPLADPGPENDTVSTLRRLWAEVLGTADFGMDEDFFDLGGNSMTAVQLSARIRDAFGVELSAGALFELTTIRLLAKELSA